VGRLGDRGSREAIEIICDPVRTSLQEFDIVFEVDCKAYRSLGHDDVVGKYRAAILPLEEEQRRVVEGAYAGDTSAGLWSGNVIWQKSRGERLLPTGSLADPFLLSVGIGFPSDPVWSIPTLADLSQFGDVGPPRPGCRRRVCSSEHVSADRRCNWDCST